MSQEPAFRRNIGLFLAVMIGIGAMMGPGIFALPGEVAEMVGPLGILVYLAMGLLTVFTALNYSELGAAIPLAGGGYSFVSRTMPRPVAFFTGWFFWIGNTLRRGPPRRWSRTISTDRASRTCSRSGLEWRAS